MMKPKLMISMIVIGIVVALLLVAGCSKKTPATKTAAPAAPTTATPAAPQTPVVQEAAAPATPPELTQADQAVQDIGTSDLSQVDKDIDTLAVP